MRIRAGSTEFAALKFGGWAVKHRARITPRMTPALTSGGAKVSHVRFPFGCFFASLLAASRGTKDISLHIDHDTNKPALAGTRDGSLKLTASDEGLRWSLDTSTPRGAKAALWIAAHPAYRAVSVGGSSLCHTVRGRGAHATADVTTFDLREISLVRNPADRSAHFITASEEDEYQTGYTSDATNAAGDEEMGNETGTDDEGDETEERAPMLVIPDQLPSFADWLYENGIDPADEDVSIDDALTDFLAENSI